MEKLKFIEAIVRQTLRKHQLVTASNFSLSSSKVGHIGKRRGGYCNFDVVGYDRADNILLLVRCKYGRRISLDLNQESGKYPWFKYHVNPSRKYLFAHTQKCRSIYYDSEDVSGRYLGPLWGQRQHIYWAIFNAPIYLSRQMGFAIKKQPKVVSLLLWFGEMKVGMMGMPVGWIKCRNVMILRMTKVFNGLEKFLTENFPKIKEKESHKI